MTQRKEKTGICKSVVIATVVAIRDVVKNGFHVLSYGLRTMIMRQPHFFEGVNRKSLFKGTHSHKYIYIYIGSYFPIELKTQDPSST